MLVVYSNAVLKMKLKAMLLIKARYPVVLGIPPKHVDVGYLVYKRITA